MTEPGPQFAGPGLHGRERECAAIDRLLVDARAGTGGALVVRGEAGIGKSALLEFARQRAAPMAVLSAAGVEAESDLAFAGLHELLRPILGYLGELPDIQSRAPRPAVTCVPHWKSSARWARCRGRNAPRQNCGRPGRQRASGMPLRSSN